MSLREEMALILRGAKMQRRVIGALILRELGARFGKYNFGYFWIFAEPLLFASVVGLIWQWRNRFPVFGGFEFFAVGYVLFYVFRIILARSAIAISANRALLFHRQVTLPDIFFARHIIEFLAASGVLMVFLFGLYVVNDSFPENIVKVVIALILMTLLTQGLAFLGGAISEAIEGAGRVVQLVTFIFMPIGGLFFVVEWLPNWAQDIVLWIPTVHVFELLRDGQFGSRFQAVYDLSYLAGWILVTHLLGFAALRITRERLGIEKALA